MTQNYISREELTEIQALINSLESQRGGAIIVLANVIDENAELLGSIKVAESGSYAFFPRVA